MLDRNLFLFEIYIVERHFVETYDKLDQPVGRFNKAKTLKAILGVIVFYVFFGVEIKLISEGKQSALALSFYNTVHAQSQLEPERIEGIVHRGGAGNCTQRELPGNRVYVTVDTTVNEQNGCATATFDIDGDKIREEEKGEGGGDSDLCVLALGNANGGNKAVFLKGEGKKKGSDLILSCDMLINPNKQNALHVNKHSSISGDNAAIYMAHSNGYNGDGTVAPSLEESDCVPMSDPLGYASISEPNAPLDIAMIDPDCNLNYQGDDVDKDGSPFNLMAGGFCGDVILKNAAFTLNWYGGNRSDIKGDVEINYASANFNRERYYIGGGLTIDGHETSVDIYANILQVGGDVKIGNGDSVTVEFCRECDSNLASYVFAQKDKGKDKDKDKDKKEKEKEKEKRDIGSFEIKGEDINRRARLVFAPGVYHFGDLKISEYSDVIFAPGDYYIKGDLVVEESSRFSFLPGEYSFYVEGDIEISEIENNTANNSSAIEIYAGGNFKISESTIMLDVSQIYVNEEFEIDDSEVTFISDYATGQASKIYAGGGFDFDKSKIRFEQGVYFFEHGKNQRQLVFENSVVCGNNAALYFPDGKLEFDNSSTEGCSFNGALIVGELLVDGGSAISLSSGNISSEIGLSCSDGDDQNQENQGGGDEEQQPVASNKPFIVE